MRDLHVEGDSWMHRQSARRKLVALTLLGVCLFLTDRLALLAVPAAICALLCFTTGLSPADTLRRLRAPLLTLLIVAAFNLAFATPHDAAVVALRLGTLVLFATAVTATTTIAAFIDEITALATPLETLGLLRASDIGLSVGLVVRFVPDILARYRAIHEAHRARGLKVRLTTTLIPLIILTLRDADAVAAAIDARGIRRH